MINPQKKQVVNDFYIPGTSLRGVMRSHAEMIVRTLIGDDAKPICCDPFDKQLSCSQRLEEKLRESSQAYRYACVICKMFGSTNNRSRIQVHDSGIKVRGKVSARDGIGIDRFTGGVSHGANFKNQVLEGYTFQSEFVIRNFELWQLGLLAYVFQDFKDELVTLGFGKAKGFGRVKGEIVDAIQVTYFGAEKNTQLTDLGDLMPNAREDYGFIPGGLTDASLLNSEKGSAISYHKKFTVTDQLKFWEAVAGVWNKTIPQFKPIQELVPPQKSDKSDQESGADTGTEGEGEHG